jgi:hypothetical protein
MSLEDEPAAPYVLEGANAPTHPFALLQQQCQEVVWHQGCQCEGWGGALRSVGDGLYQYVGEDCNPFLCVKHGLGEPKVFMFTNPTKYGQQTSPVTRLSPSR